MFSGTHEMVFWPGENLFLTTHQSAGKTLLYLSISERIANKHRL